MNFPKADGPDHGKQGGYRNMNKRLTAIILSLALIVAGLNVIAAPSAALAGSNRTAFVIGGWLRLRETPSYNAATIASYNTGTQVTILGSTGSWYHVQTPDGLTGYMHADYLSFTQPSGESGSGSSTSVNAWITVSSGKKINMRAEPSSAANIVAQLADGTQVRLLSEGNTWSLISANGQKGYVQSRYLNTSGTQKTYTRAWVTSQNGYGVRLRTGEGKNYPIIGVYSVGTEARILKRGAIWSHISIGSRTGYMMTEFLSSSKPVKPDPDPYTDAYVYASNGLNVCLRTGPGKGYSIIASYPTGTAAEILSGGQTWSYIRIGSNIGYMMSRYLVKDEPTPARLSVYVSDSKPFVGETLRAIYTPSDATVNCRWYDETDKKLGSSDSLLVTSDMLGKRIYVKVTGTGQYSATAESAYTDPVHEVAPEYTEITGCEINLRSGTKVNVGSKLYFSVTPGGAKVTCTWRHEDGTVIGTKTTYTVAETDRGHSIYCELTGIESQKYIGYAKSELTDEVPLLMTMEAPAAETVSTSGQAVNDVKLPSDFTESEAEPQGQPGIPAEPEDIVPEEPAVPQSDTAGQVLPDPMTVPETETQPEPVAVPETESEPESPAEPGETA